MDITLTLSFTPDEVITPGTAPRAAQPAAARASLRPRSHRGAPQRLRYAATPSAVTLTRARPDGAASTPASCPRARTSCCVGELLDTKGGRVGEPAKLPVRRRRVRRSRAGRAARRARRCTSRWVSCRCDGLAPGREGRGRRALRRGREGGAPRDGRGGRPRARRARRACRRRAAAAGGAATTRRAVRRGARDAVAPPRAARRRRAGRRRRVAPARGRPHRLRQAGRPPARGAAPRRARAVAASPAGDVRARRPRWSGSAPRCATGRTTTCPSRTPR